MLPKASTFKGIALAEAGHAINLHCSAREAQIQLSLQGGRQSAWMMGLRSIAEVTCPESSR